VIYTPWLWGERAPVDDDTARRPLQPFPERSCRRHPRFSRRCRFQYALADETVEGFWGVRSSAFMLPVGAGSDVCARFFDVGTRCVRSKPIEITRGAAFIAAAAMGEITLSGVPPRQFKRTYAPLASNRTVYDDRFGTYLEIYRQMKGVYRKLNGRPRLRVVPSEK
jgi:xylulokinase